MTKVISSKDFSFPKLNWGISAGIPTELPESKEAQERILAESEISIVESIKNNKSAEDKNK